MAHSYLNNMTFTIRQLLFCFSLPYLSKTKYLSLKSKTYMYELPKVQL